MNSWIYGGVSLAVIFIAFWIRYFIIRYRSKKSGIEKHSSHSEKIENDFHNSH